MNTSILQKCVEELKKEIPKIDYILGMLETVIALSEKPPLTLGGVPNNIYHTPYVLPETTSMDTREDPGAAGIGRIGKIS